MKIIYNTICVLICVLTLGFANLEVKYSDGTRFKWVGWATRYVNLCAGLRDEREEGQIKRQNALINAYPCSDYLHNALRLIAYDKPQVAYEEICWAIRRSGGELTEEEQQYLSEVQNG